MATAAPVIVVMDGDLQHDEDALPRLIDAVETGAAEVAVGTRYVDGGGTGDWAAGRVRMSRIATRAGQIALGTDVSDPMSGFFAIRRDAFERALPRLSVARSTRAISARVVRRSASFSRSRRASRASRSSTLTPRGPRPSACG